MKQAFVPKKFNAKSQELMEKITAIVEEYREAGYELTARQAYYQLVARGYIPNSKQAYDKIARLISDGRLAGLIDWDMIVDRTRGMRGYRHYSSIGEALRLAGYGYSRNLWEGQPCHVSVLVEKDALLEVVGKACGKYDCNYGAGRGYSSQSAVYKLAKYLESITDREKVVLYLGDHDPSGIDMTRDWQERLDMFGAGARVERIALSMDQIQTYNPPPYPAKITDKRAAEYIRKYGNESWELDALEPQVIEEAIGQAICKYLDLDMFHSMMEKEKQEKEHILRLADAV